MKMKKRKGLSSKALSRIILIVLALLPFLLGYLFGSSR